MFISKRDYQHWGKCFGLISPCKVHACLMTTIKLLVQACTGQNSIHQLITDIFLIKLRYMKQLRSSHWIVLTSYHTRSYFLFSLVPRFTNVSGLPYKNKQNENNCTKAQMRLKNMIIQNSKYGFVEKVWLNINDMIF